MPNTTQQEVTECLTEADAALTRSRGYAQANMSMYATAVEVGDLRKATERLARAVELIVPLRWPGSHENFRGDVHPEHQCLNHLRFTVGGEEIDPMRRHDGKLVLEITEPLLLMIEEVTP